MIRRATILDQHQIEELRQKAFSKISIGDYSLLQQAAILQQWQNEDFCKVLIQEEGYVIIFENKILAFGSYHFEQNQITQLYVDPAYQGWYFGKKMLQQLEAVAQANDFLDITVDAYLPTVAFFQKHHYSAIKKNLHNYVNCNMKCNKSTRKGVDLLHLDLQFTILQL
ncbi:GNAT family N-acetyltransferase [Spiroplasma sp. SV19]|uniref:GNAT family N-acetyltransferase n=1 Tax=Spiroplasma sp. SV19 TaxID=2570468 RepID=UPI0024B687E6|nr:GNAT family N-acetyltransferase [Spiroplasma sp. SV19]